MCDVRSTLLQFAHSVNTRAANAEGLRAHANPPPPPPLPNKLHNTTTKDKRSILPWRRKSSASLTSEQTTVMPASATINHRYFLRRCFRKDADMRPKVEELFEHQWLQKSWQRYEVNEFSHMLQ